MKTAVVFLALVFSAAQVYGTTYSRGLSSSGAHVCSSRVSRTVATSQLLTGKRHSMYTSSCGWFGWARCQRSREKTFHYYSRSYKAVWDTYLSCCSGWKKRGSGCPTPICRYGCSHGSCVYKDRCSCYSGWRGSSCTTHINPCNSNNGYCQQTCVYKYGQRNGCSCRRGYLIDNTDKTKCKDNDECRIGNICKCASGSVERCGASCTNTVGSFKCSCGPGFRLLGGTLCRDIDECASNQAGCLFKCVNTAGGFQCICPRGFRLVGTDCKDIPECASGNGGCEHECQNLIGSFRCKCRKGFVLENNRRTCRDVDECKSFHGCDGQCHNTVGSYLCSCEKGYELGENNRTCQDVDECKSFHGCDGQCHNTIGSYFCSCGRGYELSENNRTCQDVNECRSPFHGCDGQCHNTIGSYFCSCAKGYELSGNNKTCEALPCENILPPKHGTMTCSGLVTNANCSFSCSPGYDLAGSQFRTCLPSARWSGNRASCKVKHCEKLTPQLAGQSLSVPCFTSLGSTCRFRCRRGFFLKGDGQANCSLSSESDTVSWKIGNFSCEEIETCHPWNPCGHGGKCSVLDENNFSCNCEGTDYKGDRCQTGFVTPPIFPKLHANITSKLLSVVARPSQELQVTLVSDQDMSFEPSSSLQLRFPARKKQFTVQADKPGIRTISYTLEGPSKADFESPQTSVVFVTPQIKKGFSVFSKLFLPRGELPIGCKQHETKVLSCDVRLFSTAPWSGTPPSTNGIVNMVTGHNYHVPLSLIGFSTENLHVSREKMIENAIVMTSSQKNIELSYQKSGTCQNKMANSTLLLELMAADTMLSSFLQSLSAIAPEWLHLDVSDDNEVFDVQNIAAALAKPPLNLKQCTGFPLNPLSSVAYFFPTFKYKMLVDQDEAMLSTDEKTCFLIDVCKPAIFLSFPMVSGQHLKSTLTVFRDMEFGGLNLRVNSIGLLKAEETSTAIQGLFWDGSRLQQLLPFVYNLWLKGEAEWKMQIPGHLDVTLKIAGESFVYSKNVDDLLIDRLTQRLEMQMTGKTFINITGKVLQKDFTMELNSPKTVGKAALGGGIHCKKDDHQGIFLTLEKSAEHFLLQSPLSPFIRPLKDQTVRLAIFADFNGGRKDELVNSNEIRRFLNILAPVVLELQSVFSDAQMLLPAEKSTLDKSINLARNVSASIGKIRVELAASKSINPRKIRHLSSNINTKMEYMEKILELAKQRFLSTENNPALSGVLRRIALLQSIFPKSLRVQFGGKNTERNFRGISFHLRCNLCIQKLCFNDLSASIDHLSEDSCTSKPFPLPKFRVKAKLLKSRMSLGRREVISLQKKTDIEMSFERHSEHVTVTVEALVKVLGVHKFANVTLDKTELTFQTEGAIFEQFVTELSVVAKTKDAEDWDSLVFTVNGRMKNTSLLSRSLQTKLTDDIRYLAQKAVTSVRSAENQVNIARKRADAGKALVKEKESNFRAASRELGDKEFQLHDKRREYAQAKEWMNSTLTISLALKRNAVCEPQVCNHIFTNVCIPRVCQENTVVNVVVPDCYKVKKNIKVYVIVPSREEHFYWAPTYETTCHSSCGKGISKTFREVGDVVGGIVAGAGTIFASPKLFVVGQAVAWVGQAIGAVVDSMLGCDNYCATKRGADKKVAYWRVTNTPKKEEREVVDFECGEPKTKSVVSGFGVPYECSCSRSSKEKLKIIDPQCVNNNSICLQNMKRNSIKIRSQNVTLYNDYRDMVSSGEQVTILQMRVDKARATFDFARNELELVRARFKQQEYAEDSINITSVKTREKLGLKLDKEITDLGDKALVSVNDLSFSTSLTSSTKTLFSLTVSLTTADGKNKFIEIPMDFRRVNKYLTSASRMIIETLYGTPGSRRRRSVRDEQFSSEQNNFDVQSEQFPCLFSQEANVLFADVIGSLEFVARRTREHEEAMSMGMRSLEDLSISETDGDYEVGDHPTEGMSSSPSTELSSVFNEMVQSLKESQLNSSNRTIWNNTLEDWRGFLDILTQKKNFTECSGIQDCVNYFFDTLKDLYEFEHNSRAVEIKELIHDLQKIVNAVLQEDYPLPMIEDMIAQAKYLVNKSNDATVLCGKKPNIVESSPAEVVGLDGETLQLTCRVTNPEDVTYLWMKNGQLVEDANSSVLVLEDVAKESEGAYKCEVSNNRGRAVSNVTIVAAHQTPNITEEPHDLQLLVGHKTASLVCNSTGVPRPLTEWFFVPMRESFSNATALNFTEPVLTLHSLTAGVAGFYYCTVSNLHGTARSRMARVDVLGFSSGIARLAVSLELVQCLAGNISEPSRPNCDSPLSSQTFNTTVSDMITQKIFTHTNLSRENVYYIYYSQPPNVSLSFIVRGDEIAMPKDNSSYYEEILNGFSQSRIRLGHKLKVLYSALEDGRLTYQWKNVLITAEKESLAAGFLTQKCPTGKKPHENGFLCVNCSHGFYGLTNGTCLPCPAGTYQPEQASTRCLECPFRVSYTEPGAIRESQCSDISIPCKAPKIPSNGHIKAPRENNTLYKSGEAIELGCNLGYKAVEDGKLQCDEGNWTSSNFTCEQTCLPPWAELNKRCYKVIQVPTGRWKDGFSQCRRSESQMVSISSQEENDFVGNLAKSYNKPKGLTQLWLGLRKMYRTDNFTWVDGSAIETFSNWLPGEPNNLRGGELCSEMLISEDYGKQKWNDVKCTTTHQSLTVCEKPLIREKGGAL